MHCHYADILERIAEPPTWFDENGTPRWGVFTPRASANIYAREVILLVVSCQHCARQFRVCMTADMQAISLAEKIRTRTLHYGDPPNVDCCAGGPTMNSVPQKVLEYWAQNGTLDSEGSLEWKRDGSFEVDVVPDWANDVEDSSAP